MRTIIIYFLFFTCILHSQQAIVSTGSNATGNGNISFTVGQLTVLTHTANNGIVVNGVQQNVVLYTLSNKDLDKLEVLTYPNPAKDFLIIDFKNESLQDLNFVFYDIAGRETMKGRLTKSNMKISLQYFSKGMYILVIKRNNLQINQFKIIKN